MSSSRSSNSSYQQHQPHSNHNNNNHNNNGNQFPSVHMTVTVPFATLHYDDSGSNVTYALLCHDLQNNIKWMVKRRYNDLKALHAHVGRHVPESADIFPSSGGFFRSRTNTQRSSIEKRRSQIDRYMIALVNSLLQMTSAKHQMLCQPLIAKLLQFVEYPEWEEDDDELNDDYAHNLHQQYLDPNDPFAAGSRASQHNQQPGGPLPFWKSADDDKASVTSKGSAASSLFAVSSVVEEAFNAQSRDIEITRSGSGLEGGPGSSYANSEGTPSLRSLASSNAEDTNPQLIELLSNVTTYWAAPEEVKGQCLAVEIPDVACQPTIDGEFSVTVRHSVRHTARGEVRRKYDEMLYVVSKIFATDNVPTPAQMREIILQFRRQNPKRQYNSNGSVNISASNKKDKDKDNKDNNNNSSSKDNNNNKGSGLKMGDLASLEQQNNGDDDYYCYTTGTGNQQQQEFYSTGFDDDMYDQNGNPVYNTNNNNQNGGAAGSLAHSDSALMMSDNMEGTYNNNYDQQQQQNQQQQPNIPSGGIAIPANLIRNNNNNNNNQAYELNDQGNGITPFASPPARGPLADGTRTNNNSNNTNNGGGAVNQLPSQFGNNNNMGNSYNSGGNVGGGSSLGSATGGAAVVGGRSHMLQVRQRSGNHLMPRVSNSNHLILSDQGRVIPFRECKCSELAFCASGKTDHLQTPCGYTLIVEPTDVPNQGTVSA